MVRRRVLRRETHRCKFCDGTMVEDDEKWYIFKCECGVSMLFVPPNYPVWIHPDGSMEGCFKISGVQDD